MSVNKPDDYYSVDRLVEFGISMAVAQQMISGFQQALSVTSMTPVMNQIQPTHRVYYALINDIQVGPLSYHDIIKMIRDRELLAETLLWTPGNPSWSPAVMHPEIMSIVATTPPQISDLR